MMPVRMPVVSRPTSILIGPSYPRSSGSRSVVQKAKPATCRAPDCGSLTYALKCGGSPSFGENEVAVGNSRLSCTSSLGSTDGWPATIIPAAAATRRAKAVFIQIRIHYPDADQKFHMGPGGRRGVPVDLGDAGCAGHGQEAAGDRKEPQLRLSHVRDRNLEQRRASRRGEGLETVAARRGDR